MLPQMWNRFVESSEEDQRRLLNYRGLHDIKEDKEEVEEEGNETMVEHKEGGAVNSEDIWVMILDKRSGGYSSLYYIIIKSMSLIFYCNDIING